MEGWSNGSERCGQACAEGAFGVAAAADVPAAAVPPRRSVSRAQEEGEREGESAEAQRSSNLHRSYSTPTTRRPRSSR